MMLNSVGLWLTNRHQSNHYNLKSYIYCITTLANSGGPIYFYLKKTLHKNTNNWMNHNPSSRWLVHVQPVAPFTLHACCFPRQCATETSCPQKILKVLCMDWWTKQQCATDSSCPLMILKVVNPFILMYQTIISAEVQTPLVYTKIFCDFKV